MKKALKEHWDIIISDYKMPKFSGPDALRVLHALKLDIPFIIVSGSIGEDAAVELLKEGAHDFLTKMNLARLVPAIEREIEEFKIRKAHKQAEEALQQSEQRYQTLALMSPVGIFCTDASGSTTYVNPRWCQISGLSAEEALGYGWLKAVHPDDKEKLSGGWKKSTHTRKGSSAEYRFVRSDGTIAWVMGQAVPEKNSKNQIVGYVGTITDITERKLAELASKRTEEALRESEEKFRNLVENINDVFYSSDGQGRFIYCSPNFYTSMGYSLQEIIGNSYIRIVAPVDRRKVVDHYLEETKNGVLDTKLELRVRCKDGKIFWVEQNTRIVRNTYGNVVEYRNVVRDISERKRIEEALSESEETFRNLFEESADPILLLDDTGFTDCNQSTAALLGYASKDEFLNKQPWELSPERQPDGMLSTEKAKVMIATALKHGYNRFEWIHTKSDGTNFPVEVMLTSITLKGKQLFYTIWRDITERKQAEELLKKSEQTLRQSEERYRSLFDRMMDGVYRSTHEGKFVDVNPAMVQMFGFSSKEEMLNVDIKKELYFAPSERDSLFMDTGKERIETFRMRRKDGSEIWVEDHSSYVHDEKGNVIFHEGILRDVTERKRTEDELRKKEDRMRLLVEGTPHLFFYTQDIERKTTYISPSVEKITGYPAVDWFNQTHWFVTDNKINEYAKERTHAHLRGEFTEGSILLEVEHAEKYPILLEIYESPMILNGKVVGIQGIAHDITERKKSELALQESERKISTLIGNLPGMAYRCVNDRNWTMKYVSQGCIELTGYQPEELIDNKNLSFNDLIEENYREKLWNKWQEVLKNKEVFQDEYTIKTADGKQKWVWEQGCGIYSDSGEVIALEGLIIDITGRKRSEEAMLKLTKAVESSGEVIFMTDPNGIFTYVNPEFTKLYGHEPDVVIGKATPRILKSGAVKQEEYQVFWQTLLNKQVVEMELINKTKDGKLINVEVAINPVTDEKQNIIGFLAIQKDITERKKAEVALAANEASYRGLFNGVGEAIYVQDHEGRFLDVNSTAERMYGYSRETLIGKTPLFVSAPGRNDLDKVGKMVERAFAGESQRFEFWGKRANGETFPKEVRLVRGTYFGQDVIIASADDITERKKAEEALKLQTLYFTQLFENSPTGIAFLDTNERVMNVNKAFENIFQYPFEEIKGKSLTNLIVPEELVKESLSFSSRAIQGGLVQLSSVRKRKDGTRLDMVITGYPIMIEGKCVGIYAIFADVSDIKKLEDQIRQAQKLESIGTLAGGIAHDFNNILGIILGYTSLLEDGAANPAKIKLSMDAITKAVHRGAGLVKQILTFARKTNIVIEPVNVNDLIQELVKMLNETFPKTITFSVNLDGTLPNIIADHNQIHQSILNLSVNARDAIFSKTANGHYGTITFATKKVPGDELRKKIPDAIDDEYACVSVTDNGSGMDEATIARVFEPFFTTKEQGKGTGLGLPVVYGVVKSHRGFIDVQSELGVGTTFNLYFPFEVQEVVPEKVDEEVQAPIPGGNETILFVEDEEMLQEVVKAQLTLKGYRVLSAFDGEEAVEMYRKHQNEIAVVLSDLGLPKLGGFEAFLQMKKINPNAKIVLASGFFDPAQKSGMLEAGVEYFVQKPYRANEIFTAIRKLLDKK
ncbi:MAG: PAS domain S-box protein [Bacteroidota bacterium]|nr:PAS domain S-box protein [Bacteroidota bacterium]